jgi:hypothetical protein
VTAISADRSVAECLVRVRDTLLSEFGHAVPARIIEGVVHEACERVVQGAATPDEEQLLLQTSRISLQARVDLGRG